MNAQQAVAMARFGLGRRHGEALPDDPPAWLKAQLEGPDPAPVDGRPSSADGLALVLALKQAGAAAGVPVDHPDPGSPLGRLRAHEAAELADTIGWALVTPAPFRERLVWFWANHFTVARRTRDTAATAGAYVREAIRPHVTGRFGDMLLAVMRHPAMLSYLDQAQSVGPDSMAGQRLHRGLNENLARECLELHTVTPAAGYSQQDVTAFADILTGWSLELRTPPLGFRFRPGAHEPGARTVMGRVWPEGEAGGLAILAWLAEHPATQRHLAEKLVRHFVADEPDPRDVAAIAGVLRVSGSDLGAAAAALAELPAAWRPLAKLRTPQDLVVAGLRATGARPEQVPNLPGMIGVLGQPLFNAPFPIGWPDRAADWASPEAMLQRVNFAAALAARAKMLDPEALAAEQLGPLAPAPLMDAIRRAGSRQDALTLLFASPEFQRR